MTLSLFNLQLTLKSSISDIGIAIAWKHSEDETPNVTTSSLFSKIKSTPVFNFGENKEHFSPSAMQLSPYIALIHSLSKLNKSNRVAYVSLLSVDSSISDAFTNRVFEYPE